MKAKYMLSTSLKTLAVSAPLLIVPSVFALEKPSEEPKAKADVEDRAPNKRAGKPEVAEEPAARPVEKMAMLGVGGNTVSQTLSTHLGLAKGTGLTIYHVVPDSAAAKAGIESHDVITSIDGKPVDSQEQLRDIIEDYKPGDEVNVKLIHKGEVKERKAVLGERVVAPVRGIRPMNDLRRLQPNDLLDMFEGMGGNIPELDRRGVEREMRKHMDDLRRQLRQLENEDGFQPFPNGLDMNRGIEMLGGIKTTIRDPEGSVTVKTQNGKKEVIVRDQEGKVVFEGPYDTKQDKAAVPDNIADRIKKAMDIGMNRKFKFDINPKRMKPDLDQ